ncbi:hypothetical protein A0H81_01180 [Grifola frondosa]|uniref:Zn(2)-C6 fungal-type domain-containing protein n=1 Tax=Grifola frondosa TaxID=5627 RepID=A0A1C7MPE2_GRIFR|nr:hypothetical protein A0H81_01180 [Grifola frondosa]
MSNSPYILQDFFFEQYNQQSEDDGDPGSSNRTLGKRGTRACDRCRRVKSKCEPDVGNKCKNCNIANTPCTYQSPNFKRGPPKGYIHSIEQRWHQVDDPFARSILDRVQAGPYGTGRSSPVPTAQSFYASLIDVPEHTPLREDRRYRRQSRVSREIVSLEDGSALRTPTREWQDQLSRQLAGSHVAFAGQSFSGYQSDVEEIGFSLYVSHRC